MDPPHTHHKGKNGPSPLPLPVGRGYIVLGDEDLLLVIIQLSVVITPLPCGGVRGRVRWGLLGLPQKRKMCRDVACAYLP